jgi:hypothetical protein
MASEDRQSYWDAGWEQRFEEAAKKMGYGCFLEFMDAHPGEPYGPILRRLREQAGCLLPLMQLHLLHLRQAHANRETRDIAIDTLIRSLRQYLARGWNNGKKTRERRIDARTDWVLPHDAGREMDARADHVWQEIERLSPPDDWCPASPEDPILQEAFRRGWEPEI